MLAEQTKQRRRQLDRCLYAVENVAEAGSGCVPSNVIDNLPIHIDGLQADMPVRRALDLIFDLQAKLVDEQPRSTSRARQPSVGVLAQSPVAAVDGGEAGPLTASEARDLTQRILGGVETVSLLVLQSHDRRAWHALGYATWKDYARDELGLSRSRSYELLQHARVIKEIMRASGLSHPPTISPYAALQVKPHLPHVLDEITSTITSVMNEREIALTVEAIVDGMRADSPSGLSRRRNLPPNSASEGAVDVDATICEVIDLLLKLPSVDQIRREIGNVHLRRPSQLQEAAHRLMSIATLFATHDSAWAS